MADDILGVQTLSLEPLPYHLDIARYLQQWDQELWNWFATHRTSGKYADDVRFELLKSTYRVESETQPALYTSAAEVAAKLGVNAAISIYQAQYPEGCNASLAYVPGEVHLVLHGPLATQLTEEELPALLGHEFSHYLLWDTRDGELQVVSELLRALVTEPNPHPAYFASWRLFNLYTEIYCDRGALAVVNDVQTVVSMLVKIHTNVWDVDAAAYLRQADEIFERAPTAAEGITHPEAFIRARALKLWADAAPDVPDIIAQMIHGRPGLDELDLLGQERVATQTRQVIDSFFAHRWFHTDATLAHARLFFDDYTPRDSKAPEGAVADMSCQPATLRDYFCFMLLDFVTVDRQLEDVPLAVALGIAEQLNIKPRFLELVKQELRLRQTQLDKLDKKKAEVIAAADRSVVTKT